MSERKKADLGPQRLLSMRQACHYLGVSRSNFQKAVQPHVKTALVGARRLVDRQSLDSFVDERMDKGDRHDG